MAVTPASSQKEWNMSVIEMEPAIDDQRLTSECEDAERDVVPRSPRRSSSSTRSGRTARRSASARSLGWRASRSPRPSDCWRTWSRAGSSSVTAAGTASDGVCSSSGTASPCAGPTACVRPPVRTSPTCSWPPPARPPCTWRCSRTPISSTWRRSPVRAPWRADPGRRPDERRVLGPGQGDARPQRPRGDRAVLDAGFSAIPATRSPTRPGSSSSCAAPTRTAWPSTARR